MCIEWIIFMREENFRNQRHLWVETQIILNFCDAFHHD